MAGNEWLNIQDAFSIFLGNWILLYLAVALAGAIGLAVLNLVWEKIPRVRIIGSDKE